MLTGEELKKQKNIFEMILIKEIAAELQFVWDVSMGRASRRKDYTDKVVDFLTTLVTGTLGFLPLSGTVAAVASSAVGAAGYGYQASRDNQQDKDTGAITPLLTEQKPAILMLHLQQFAKLASLRYEQIIANVIEPTPESIVLFAQIGARRAVDYLIRVAKESPDVFNLYQQKNKPLVSLLLDGLIQGHSGKGKEFIFSNNECKNVDGKNITVEGAYAHAAMRELPLGLGETDSAKWPIFYLENPRHLAQGVDKSFSWGRVSFVNKNKSEGPKYGFMLVDKDTRVEYGYETPFADGKANLGTFYARPENTYHPAVYIASKEEVEAYEKELAGLKQGEQRPSFFRFIRRMVLDKTNRQRAIEDVWVRDAKFANFTFTGDYSQVDFTGCNFNDSMMNKAIFSETNMSCVTAKKMKCREAVFMGTNFSCANLDEAEFNDCQMENITYTGAKIGKMKRTVGTKEASLPEMKTELPKPMHEVRVEQQKLNAFVESKRSEVASTQDSASNEVKKILSDIDTAVPAPTQAQKAQVEKLKTAATTIGNLVQEASDKEMHYAARAAVLKAEVKDVKEVKASSNAGDADKSKNLQAEIAVLEMQLRRTQEESSKLRTDLTQLKEGLQSSVKARGKMTVNVGEKIKIGKGAKVTLNTDAAIVSMGVDTVSAADLTGLMEIANQYDYNTTVLNDAEIEKYAVVSATTISRGVVATGSNQSPTPFAAEKKSSTTASDLMGAGTFKPKKDPQQDQKQDKKQDSATLDIVSRIGARMKLKLARNPDLKGAWNQQVKDQGKIMASVKDRLTTIFNSEEGRGWLNKLSEADFNDQLADAIAERIVDNIADISSIEIEPYQIKDGINNYKKMHSAQSHSQPAALFTV